MELQEQQQQPSTAQQIIHPPTMASTSFSTLTPQQVIHSPTMASTSFSSSIHTPSHMVSNFLFIKIYFSYFFIVSFRTLRFKKLIALWGERRWKRKCSKGNLTTSMSIKFVLKQS